MIDNKLTYRPLNNIISIIDLNHKSYIKLLFFLIFTGIITPKNIQAQDLHYSQYLNSPLNLNPALTAYSQADYRLILNNRSQWASVTVPYKTISGSFDFKLLNRKKSRDYFGLGIIFNNDEAGDSHYGTTQVGLSLSWVKSLSRKNHHIISLGIQGSYLQRSIDYSQLYFSDQWDGISSGNNSSTELFTINNFNFADFSAGAHYLFTPNRKFKLNSGISVWHINTPRQNLMDDQEAFLSIKTQLYTEAEIITDTQYDILPSLMIATQGEYREIIFGTKIYYKINKSRKHFMALSTGIYGRNNDAVILFTGIDYKNARLGISYDINLSPLKAASQYQGGLEISLKWLIFKNKKTQKIQPTPCPIF